MSTTVTATCHKAKLLYGLERLPIRITVQAYEAIGNLAQATGIVIKPDRRSLYPTAMLATSSTRLSFSQVRQKLWHTGRPEAHSPDVIVMSVPFAASAD